MDMAEISGQNGQEPLRILLGFVPTHQRVRREDMAHVMQARAVAVSCAAQADLARQNIECSMNISDIKAVAQLGSEQIRKRRLGRTMLSAAFEIILEHCAG